MKVIAVKVTQRETLENQGSTDTSLITSTLCQPSQLMQIQDEDSILREVKAALEDEILLAQWLVSSGNDRQFAASIALVEWLRVSLI